uniref:Enoyl-[acyl-carrier-protein] reductase, mitochondrial n=1 Tax=Ascaris lumbricoides TaxID=6252 RepID=A0A0M3HG76_ASCLU
LIQYLSKAEVSSSRVLQVLKLSEKVVSDSPGVGEVLVRWIASPVNPIDLGKISGHYPTRIELPCIGGSEGVGLVEKGYQNIVCII